jgi:hypothetical protein
VVTKNGSMVTAKRGEQLVTRNSSFFKLSPRYLRSTEFEPHDQVDLEISETSGEIEPACVPDASSSTFMRRSGRERQLPRHFNDYVL